MMMSLRKREKTTSAAEDKFTLSGKRLLILIHVCLNDSIGEWKNSAHFGALAIRQLKKK